MLRQIASAKLPHLTRVMSPQVWAHEAAEADAAIFQAFAELIEVPELQARACLQAGLPVALERAA
eukprot:9023935-Prorocentrum_lima.AAC.1